MPPPARPWESGAAANETSTALTIAPSSGLVTSPTAPPLPTTATATAAGRLGTVNNRVGYSGLGGGYGGMGGMSSYGMGGMGSYGMGGMGGYGMGGMGMGMGGMGMMGMGMGGMGMGMYGGSEMEQRGQMALMVIGRVVEMFHAFTNVMHMSIGSATQFMGSYIGLSQQYQQLSAGPVGPDGLPLADETGLVTSPDGQIVNVPPPRPSLSTVLFGLLKKLLFIAVALFIASRIHRYFSKPKQITEADLENAFHNAAAAANTPVQPQAINGVPQAGMPMLGSGMGMGMGMGMGYGRGAYNAFGYSPGGLNYGMNY